jgi:bifunctional UDP-N-acetylglucosamine pyrophosphorylase/glucosamine-1-phosphate N-acetyltransferase
MIGIILAAGKSRRMGLGYSKVLLALKGRPVLSYVIELAQKAGLEPIYIVVGPEHDEIVRAFQNYSVRFVVQKEARGTADAVKACKEFLKPQDVILVLYGDTPLLQASTIRKLQEIYCTNTPDCVLLTTFLDNPKNYGRILRDAEGNIKKIIEEVEASEEIKKINEINVGVYIFRYASLAPVLESLTPSPFNGEYYLTSAVNTLISTHHKVLAVSTENSYECLGINTPEDLEVVQKFFTSAGTSKKT